MPHSTGQREEREKCRRERFKDQQTPKCSWCTQHKWAAQPGSQGQLNKVSKCPQVTWLCPCSKALSTALPFASQCWRNTWHGPEGPPGSRKPCMYEPGFTRGRDTNPPLKCRFTINANQPQLPVGHVACLNEKQFSSLCKKDLKTELGKFSTS